MPASRIFRLARTRRCAIVTVGTTNARAISSVSRPPRVRSVSAICDSLARAGWQQVKIAPQAIVGYFARVEVWLMRDRERSGFGLRL